MKNVALVCMPWAPPNMPSVALGLLKSVLESKNIPTEVHYLNLHFAKRIDKEAYEEIAGSTIYVSEWIFAQYLFNQDKVNEFKNNYKGLIQPIINIDTELYAFLRKRKDVIEPIINTVIPQFIDECLNNIKWNEYKTIGFTCIQGLQLSSLLLSKKIKQKFPNVKIVFGGPNVRDVMGEEIIEKFHWVDYVIDGEGEVALTTLAQNICEDKFYEEIPGVIFRRNGTIVCSSRRGKMTLLDKLPITDHSDYYNELENLKPHDFSPIINTYEGSRGCWWAQKSQCAFCGICDEYIEFRTKSQEKVLNELIEQTNKYNNKNYFFTDFILNLDYFDYLLPQLIEKKLNLNILLEVKSNLKREQLIKLRDAGMRCAQPGMESLNTKILKLMRKGVTAIQNVQFLKLCRELDISVLWNLLYRIPGEDKQCYDEILNLIPLIIHLHPPASGSPSRIILHRFSPHFTEPEKYGVKDVKPKEVFKLIYPDEKVDLNKIAYSFDYSFDNADDIVKSYFGKLDMAISVWRRSFREKKYYCTYSSSNNSVEINDNRPISLKQEQNEPVKYILEGIDKYIFLLCDEIHSFNEIYKDINENTDFNIAKDQLYKTLNKLKNYRLLYEENQMYINLAVDKKEGK